MNLRTRFCGIAVALLLVLLPGIPATGQTDRLETGNQRDISRRSTTGAGAHDETTAASRDGKADGQGNPRLGGKRRPLYRLTPGDVLTVSFSLSPEYDQQPTVQPDGYLMLRDAGAVYAQGLTLDEFGATVGAAYRGYLHNPKISVALKEFDRPYFIAGGELARPGKYDLRSDTTVLEAIEIAGGFTQRAKHSQVVLFRRADGDLYDARLLNVKKMLAERNLGEDDLLRPGDLVFVPQNALSKIAQFLSKPGVNMYVSPTQF